MLNDDFIQYNDDTLFYIFIKSEFKSTRIKLFFLNYKVG